MTRYEGTRGQGLSHPRVAMEQTTGRECLKAQRCLIVWVGPRCHLPLEHAQWPQRVWFLLEPLHLAAARRPSPAKLTLEMEGKYRCPNIAQSRESLHSTTNSSPLLSAEVTGQIWVPLSPRISMFQTLHPLLLPPCPPVTTPLWITPSTLHPPWMSHLLPPPLPLPRPLGVNTSTLQPKARNRTLPL